jgi:predicted transcriptional regulator
MAAQRLTALRAVNPTNYLVADGEDSDEIARAMGYAERTVKNIVHDICTKLGARNRAHAVAIAIRLGELVIGDRATLDRRYTEQVERERDEALAKLDRISERW